MKYFAIVNTDEVHPNLDDKLIPAAEFSQLLSASELLEKTEQECQKKIERTKKNCQNLRKQAKDAGHLEGLDQFTEHVLYFEKQIKLIRHETQQQILNLALKAAKKIVNKEIELNPDSIVDIVKGVLRPVTQYSRIKIYVNKEDKDFLEREKENLKQIFDRIESFSIVERDDVEKGGCLIETEAGIINASLDNQWRSLEAAFEAFNKPS